jgi:3-hydroxyisobutyrate dehydrogenase-like beta-hydroxyacid dehydrogenase
METILKGDVKDKLIIDCSTVHPDTTSMTAKAIEARGGKFVACPMFGAPSIAGEGQLVCVLAGPKEEVEEVIPYCKGVIGRANTNFSGQSAEKATLPKVIGNTFILSMVSTILRGASGCREDGIGCRRSPPVP